MKNEKNNNSRYEDVINYGKQKTSKSEDKSFAYTPFLALCDILTLCAYITHLRDGRASNNGGNYGLRGKRTSYVK